MQPTQPPFQPPPPAPPSAPASNRVQGPAIGLIVTGAFGILLGLFGLLGAAGGTAAIEALRAQNPSAFANVPPALFSGAASVLRGLFGIAMGGLVIFGGLQMKQLRNYPLAIAATIVAMVPCLGPCCCIGLPIGIWGLVVLLDANVKASFTA